MSCLSSRCFSKLNRYFFLFLMLAGLSLVVRLYTINYAVSKTKQDSIEQRTSQIFKSCRKPNTNGSSMDLIFYSEAHNLCYCGVAKAGCTFWKKVIRYLNHDTGNRQYHHPNDIPRHIVHWGMKNTTQTQFSSQFFSNYERFMFVRNPFTRLWSGYIDKLFLPDFWMKYGAVAFSSRCPLNVTFGDFVKWVLDTPPEVMDAHWSPMSYVCDPCTFRPTFLGKMESFVADARHLLFRHNLSWILDSNTSKPNENEMLILIKYYFKLFKYGKTKTCIDARGLALRLWRAFQLNGHLSNDEHLNLSNHDTITEEEFTTLVMDASTRQKMTSADLHHQKEQHLKQAFDSLSSTTVAAIRQKYALDFEMFGYDEMT